MSSLFPLERIRSLPRTRLKPGGAATLSALLALLVYALTVAPTISEFDSSEFVTGAYTLGIVHAPGYPLYLLMGHVATQLSFGAPALALNLLSSVFAAMTTALVVLIAHRLTKNTLISSLIGLMMAFAYPMWAFAVVAEVYTLAAFLASALVYACLLYDHKPTSFRFVLVIAIFSLNLTNHLAVVMAAPFLVLFLFLRERAFLFRPDMWAKGVLAGILALGLYLYLPLRWSADPSFNYVGRYFSIDLATPKGIIWMVSGRMFSHRMFDTSLLGGLGNLTANIELIGFSLLGVGLAMIILGALDTPPLLVMLFGGGAFSMLVFFSFYDVADASTMLLPVFIFLVPLIANGFIFFRDFLASVLQDYTEASTVVQILGVVTVIALLVLNWADVNRSRDLTTYGFAHVVLQDVDANALIVSHWETAAPLNYMHIVEGRRPDVSILDRGGHALGTYDLLRREHNISEEDTLRDVSRDRLLAIITEELTHRPVYITDDDWLLDYVVYEQQGPIYRVYEVRAQISQ